MEDTKITELFFSRDRSAVGELWKKYGKRAEAVAKNTLGDARDAEECCNDALLAVWQRIPPERPECLGAYLLKIVRKISVSRLRKNTAQKRGTGADVLLSELDDCVPDGFDVSERVEARELSAVINVWLRGLDPCDRTLFVQRYFSGEQVNDLAAAFGEKPGAVSVKLFRLRQDLKKTLIREGYLNERE